MTYSFQKRKPPRFSVVRTSENRCGTFYKNHSKRILWDTPPYHGGHTSAFFQTTTNGPFTIQYFHLISLRVIWDPLNFIYQQRPIVDIVTPCGYSCSLQRKSLTREQGFKWSLKWFDFNLAIVYGPVVRFCENKTVTATSITSAGKKLQTY